MITAIWIDARSYMRMSHILPFIRPWWRRNIEIVRLFSVMTGSSRDLLCALCPPRVCVFLVGLILDT